MAHTWLTLGSHMADAWLTLGRKRIRMPVNDIRIITSSLVALVPVSALLFLRHLARRSRHGCAAACWALLLVLSNHSGAVSEAHGAEPKHGIAMHGEPALPAGFTRLPYADPAAPQRGRLVQGVLGTFDSLNPLIVRGNRPAADPRLRGRKPDGPRL